MSRRGFVLRVGIGFGVGVAAAVSVVGYVLKSNMVDAWIVVVAAGLAGVALLYPEPPVLRVTGAELVEQQVVGSRPRVRPLGARPGRPWGSRWRPRIRKRMTFLEAP